MEKIQEFLEPLGILCQLLSLRISCSSLSQGISAKMYGGKRMKREGVYIESIGVNQGRKRIPLPFWKRNIMPNQNLGEHDS
jgi:hypothetical protein